MQQVRPVGSWILIVCALGSLAMFNACARDYVTGKRTFSLISESQEIAMGREADRSIVVQYGLLDDPALSAYVNGLGQSLAKVSHRPALTYTFRLLDSPVVNAFALPGGWIYITRGILANFNSEDELVGVLGHELGHVVARHGAEQMSRQVLTGAGVGLLQTVDLPLVGDLVGATAGLLFLKFSREQESESDRLGVEYSTKTGYDSHRMADFFRTLARLGAESDQSLPSFLSTHPDPGDREATVNRLTDEWRSKIPYKPRNTDRAVYLKRLDGLVYGPNPRQGFVEDGMFYHPDLKFQFPVPSGWKLQNLPSVVQMVDANQNAVITFELAREASADAAADSFIARTGVAIRSRSTARVSGARATVLESAVTSNDGQTVAILSYFIARDRRIHAFHGFTDQSNWSTYAPVFRQTMSGLGPVTSQRVLSVKPDRIRLSQAPREGEVAAVLREMGVARARLSELAILNGRSLSDRVAKGEWLKVIGK